MHICFFSPYFPHHFGGGEKHLLDVALEASRNHTVSIAIPSTTHSYAVKTESADIKKIRTEYEKFYGESLSKIKFVHSPLGTNKNFFTKLFWTSSFDALYYVSDGSLFFSLAKYNYLHIQIPFTHGLSVIDKVKLLCWHSINTNSAFTKRIIEKNWQVKVGPVIHPMVDIEHFKKQRKEKIILHVGRFFKQLHSKRQDILVEVFKKLIEENSRALKGWKLYFVGSVEDKNYFEDVHKAAEGYSVEFISDASRAELVTLYERASIYWHATGFGVDEEKNPERVEHFGITTIEAMAAGTVPLVVGKGGQREVLGDLFYDLHWNTQQQCLQKTLQLIQDHGRLDDMQQLVKKQAEKFSKREFSKKIFALFSV